MRLLEETGMDPQAIDTCMTLGAGHPMGPLALLDFVGLDVSQGDRRDDRRDVPPRCRELIARGRAGRKSGRGFTLLSARSHVARPRAVASEIVRTAQSDF